MSRRRLFPSLFRKTAETRRYSAGPYYAFRGNAYTPPSEQFDPDTAVRDAWGRVIWVYRAIDARAKNAAKLRVMVMDGRGDDAKEIADHPVAKLLNGRANPFESAFAFRYRLSTLMDLSLRGVPVEVIESRAGDPVRLQILNPQITFPLPDPDEFVSGFEMRLPSGEVFRELPVYQPGNGSGVLWIKRPHPTDPYQSSTWLQAAGISVDLDYYARLFNLRFLQNDGRPGGVLAVSGDLDPADAEVMALRMSGGPNSAGKVTIMEADDLNYIDLATNARDAQYVQSRALTQKEILIAAGTPLSVIGDASGRTFDNADAEEELFWRNEMVPEVNLLASFWEFLTNDGTEGDEEVVTYDWSDVAVLQRDERSEEARARDEFDAGLISIDEYRERTGKDPIDVPGSRVLWGAAGKAPIGSDEDVVALLSQGQAPPPPPEGGAPVEPGTNPDLPPDGTAPEDVEPAEEAEDETGLPPQELLDEANYTATKALTPDTGVEAQRKAHAALIDEWETTLARELAALSRRQEQVILARLKGAKARRHTRHWEGGDPGRETKALDPAYIADRRTWIDGVVAAIASIVKAAYNAAGQATAVELGTEDTYEPSEDAPKVIAATVRAIAEGFDARAGRLQQIISDADDAGDTIEQIADKVSKAFLSADTWSQASSRQIVGAMNAASLASAADAGAAAKRWLATDDERTRPTHRKAEGQVVPLDKPFHVGESDLAFPGDPTGLPQEWINCRCTMLFQIGARTPDQEDADLDADLADLDAFEAGEKTLDDTLARMAVIADVLEAKVGVRRVIPVFRAPNISFDPLDHPRDYRGRFIDVPDVELPDGTVGQAIASDEHGVTVAKPDGDVVTVPSSTLTSVEPSPVDTPTAPTVPVFQSPTDTVGQWQLAATPDGHYGQVLDTPDADGNVTVLVNGVPTTYPRDDLTPASPPPISTSYGVHADRHVWDAKGHVHWGAAGAAGVLIRHDDQDGTRRYLMQLRSPGVQHGNTWSVPGGAMHIGEQPEDAAIREAFEELGDIPDDVIPVDVFTDDHGGWAYHTVVLQSPTMFMPKPTLVEHSWGSYLKVGDNEGRALGWFTADEIDAMSQDLHPSFRQSWPALHSADTGADYHPDMAHPEDGNIGVPNQPVPDTDTPPTWSGIGEKAPPKNNEQAVEAIMHARHGKPNSTYIAGIIAEQTVEDAAVLDNGGAEGRGRRYAEDSIGSNALEFSDSVADELDGLAQAMDDANWELRLRQPGVDHDDRPYLQDYLREYAKAYRATAHPASDEDVKAPQTTSLGEPEHGVKGDYEKARAMVPSIEELMAEKGLTAEEAKKEWDRLFHNARFRVRRARLKAEKEAAKAKTDDMAHALDPTPPAAPVDHNDFTLIGIPNDYDKSDTKAWLKVEALLHLRGNDSSTLTNDQFDLLGTVTAVDGDTLTFTTVDGTDHHLNIADISEAYVDLEDLGDIAQATKDDHEAGILDGLDLRVKADLEADKPTALYTLSIGDRKKIHDAGMKPGPGGSLGMFWGDVVAKLDDGESIPVIDLVIQGHKIPHGTAFRHNGMSYVVEHEPGADLSEVEKKRDTLAWAWTAATAGVDESLTSLIRGQAWLAGPNPADAHHSAMAGTEFVSAATGGDGHITYWNHAPNPGTTVHEFGHTLDNRAPKAGGLHGSFTGYKGLFPDNPNSTSLITWGAAADSDKTSSMALREAMLAFPEPKSFHETRAGSHPVQLGTEGVTTYGATKPAEDFAEAVELYLKDRKYGKIGYLDPDPGQAQGTIIRFADVFPERAKFLDSVFGNDPVGAGSYDYYEDQAAAFAAQATPWQQAQAAKIQAKVISGDIVTSDTINDLDTFAAVHAIPRPVASYALMSGDKMKVEAIAKAAKDAEAKEKAEAAAKEAAELAAKTKAEQEALKEAAKAEYDLAVLQAIEDAPSTLDLTTLKGIRAQVAKTRKLSQSELSTTVQVDPGIKSIEESYPLRQALMAVLKDAKIATPTGKTSKTFKAIRWTDADGTVHEVPRERVTNIRMSYRNPDDSPAYSAFTDGIPNRYTMLMTVRVPDPADEGKFMDQQVWLEDLQSITNVRRQAVDKATAQQMADELERSLMLKALKDNDLLPEKPAILGIGVDAETTEFLSEANRLKASSTISRSGTYVHPLAEKQYGIAEQAKANLCAEIASRLNNPADWETFRKYRAALNGAGGDHYNNLDTTYGPYDDYSPTYRQAILAHEVSNRIGMWAGTSGDTNPWAVMMQRAVDAELGVGGDWDPHGVDKSTYGGYSNGQIVQQHWSSVEGWYRRFVRVQYEHTQEDFADRGITHLTLARGMKNAAGDFDWKVEGTHPVTLMPTNSWSSSLSQAKNFSVGFRVLFADVPVERVLGSALTGFGCRGEWEFSVLNGPGNVTVYKTGSIPNSIAALFHG